MKVFNAEEVKKCLEDVVGEDKLYALWLLEWAIDKRTFDLEEHDNDIRAEEREKTIDEFKEKMRNLNQLNCFIDYVGDEIDLEELMYYASEEIAEQLREQENETEG